MFTSKITELNNKNFESIRPLVNLDSIYYEQISNKDSNFHIDRQTVYKHLVPFVNTSLNKDSIDVSAYNTNKTIKKDGTIKLNSPIKYSKIENSSFVYLGSNYQYNLSDILYHFADKEFVSNEYAQIKTDLHTKILNLQDYINDNISQVYININNVSNIINTSLTNISTYIHNIIPKFSVYIDNYINDTYNKVLDFSTYINNVDISINYINTSIAIYEKSIDSLNSIVNEYNKDASTLTKVEVERLAAQLLDLLNTAPDEYKYEWVYTPEIFIEMINMALLCPGKIYNVLYYPRTIKTNIDTSVYEHNKFSMPIILEILAINEHDISYNVKAKNAIDTLTLLEKQNRQAIGLDYIEDNSAVNYINVYNMPLQDIYDATTTQQYSLKPVYLYFAGDETHEYFNPIFYDDLYGMLYLKLDGSLCTCNDSGINNLISFLNDNYMLQSFSFSETFILVMILLQYLEKQSGYKLINAKYKEINSNIQTIIDTYSNRITKNIVEVNELLLSILGNPNITKISYFFNLNSSKNIFIQLFGTNFKDTLNQVINQARAEYLKNLSVIYDEIFTEEINLGTAFYYPATALYAYIQYYPSASETLTEIQSYFNIYYDTNNSSGYMGLLYNGDNELYQTIITPDGNSLMKSNISQWLFSENDGAFYEKNPKSLQAGKIIPYENWKILIDPEMLKITHLIDEYNNEADYDFRSIPTFITFNMSQTGLNVLNEFQDDIFWQSYYRYTIDNSTYYIYPYSISKYEQTKENYTNYITQNNIIVDNNCNIDRFITNNFVISVSDGSMINQGLYYNILNSSLKTSNIDNIIIKNNKIIYLDNYSQLCFIGNNFKLTNNIININPLSENVSDNVSNNQCRSVVIRKSECLNNSIYIGNYYQIASDDTTSIESYQQGWIINSDCIDNYILRIYTSKIIESNIFGSYIDRNNFNTSSAKLINVKGAPEEIQNINNSVLYGPEAAGMYAKNYSEEGGYYIAADLYAANYPK